MSFTISKETLAVLKNFASINPNIVIHPNARLQTISDAKHIYASYEMPEASEIPLTFGIYDLNMFLAVLSMFNTPLLDIQDKKRVTISESDGSSRVRYFFADESILTSPEGTDGVKMPDTDVSVAFTAEMMGRIRKGSSTLGLSHVVIEGREDGTFIKVCDLADVTSNSYEINIDKEVDFPGLEVDKENFQAVFTIDNLKMLPGDYNLAISSKGIARFVRVDSDTDVLIGTEYFVGLETDSKFPK
mgnify:FL=1|jgi:hypothetical protein